MKKIFILLLAAAAFIVTPASAQDYLGNWLIGTATDTAKPNTTKNQTIKLTDPSKGITVQYWLQSVADSITGYASVWASIDNITYAPYPGADSVALVAHADTKKLWFLSTHQNLNPVKYVQVRTRCPSNTTNATGKAKLNTKLSQY